MLTTNNTRRTSYEELKRVHPVILDSTKIYKPRDKVKYLAFWEKEQKELEEELKTIGQAYTSDIRAELDRYADFRRLLDGLMAVLGDMNALTTEAHLENGFGDMVVRIRGMTSNATNPIADITVIKGKESEPGSNKKPDTEFEKTLRKKLSAILNHCPELEKELAAKKPQLSPQNHAAVEALMSVPVIQAIDQVLYPATKKLVWHLGGVASNEGARVWASANQLLSRLCPRLADVLERGEGTTSAMSCDLVNRSLLGVETYVAKAVGRSAAVELLKPQSLHVRSKKAVTGLGEAGWAEDARYQHLLARIWTALSPGDPRIKDDGSYIPLALDEIPLLSAKLLRDNTHEELRHLCYLALDAETEDKQWKAIVERLRTDLPGLTIAKFKTKQGASALIADGGGENDFVIAVSGFLNIPYEKNES